MVCGVAAAGFALQLTLGPFNFFLLHYPVNAGAAVALVLLLGFCHCLRATAVFQWLSGVPLCVCLIAALLCFGLVMGIVPQAAGVDPPGRNLFADLGFTLVTASWPFVLLYALTLVSLGLVIVRRLAAFRTRDLAFYCNHLGLWILLLAAGLGAADLQRFVMHVGEGETEWRVYSANQDVLELPIAVRLNDFAMEEYPPKLAVIDRNTGRPQPEGKARYLQIEAKDTSGSLGGWTVSVETYIHEAVRSEDGFTASLMPAATPAALVTAKNPGSGEIRTGWVCGGGNIPGFFSGLTLDDSLILVMTQPEPRRFVSDITVLTKEGQKEEVLLEVNRPLSIGPWMLYQYGYDNRAGKMSAYSSIELVYDPWLRPAYAGIALMLIGAFWLILTGTGKGRKDHDLG